MNGWCQVFVLLVCVSVGYGEFSPFIRAKLNCHFCAADKNQDGVIKKEDYELIANSSYPRCLRTPEDIQDFADKAWAAFPAVEMTKDQYLGAVEQLMNKTELYDAIKNLTSVMWNLWVCNTANSPDKQMDAAHFAGEFHDLELAGDGFVQGDNAVNGLDRNVDHLVSEAEYNEAGKGFITYEDQSDGSKFFFGDCYTLNFTGNDYACRG